MVGDLKPEGNELKVPSSNLKTSRKAVVLTGVVTERDAEALLWILQQGVMTVDQIFRAVRVFSFACVSSPKRPIFKITKQGQSYLLSKNIPGLTRVLYVPSTSEIPHAEVLTEIRIAIQSSGKHGDCSWWRGKGELFEDEDFPKERFRDLVPDAIWVTKSSRRVAIEFKRARKGITRVMKKVEGFDQELNRSDRAFDAVLWISIEGACRDLTKALSNRETQILRTIPEFMNELKGELGNGSSG